MRVGLLLGSVVATSASVVSAAPCPGYKATSVSQTTPGLTAALQLAGTACDIYGQDLKDLVLNVEYQTSASLENCLTGLDLT